MTVHFKKGFYCAEIGLLVAVCADRREAMAKVIAYWAKQRGLA